MKLIPVFLDFQVQFSQCFFFFYVCLNFLSSSISCNFHLSNCGHCGCYSGNAHYFCRQDVEFNTHPQPMQSADPENQGGGHSRGRLDRLDMVQSESYQQLSQIQSSLVKAECVEPCNMRLWLSTSDSVIIQKWQLLLTQWSCSDTDWGSLKAPNRILHSSASQVL